MRVRHRGGAGAPETQRLEPTAHALAWIEVARLLETEVARGLSEREAAARLRRAGPNALPPPPTARAWRILLDQFRSAVVLLLVAASGLAFVFGQVPEAVAIAIVLVLNAGIGFGTEVRAVRSMEALRKLTAIRARVRREQAIAEMPAAELVPGDVVILEAGDLVPADLRVVEANRLESDESALTGESLPVEKSEAPTLPDAPVADRRSMLFQGTAITRGSAAGIVVSTGEDTQLAKIAKLASGTHDPPSALQRRLDRLGRQMVFVVLSIGGFVVGLGVAAGRPIVLMVETAIALSVAAIPEGLPAVATLALARGMLLMARHNALVRRLSAVETLGSTNILCVDKTGTLTENRLSVARIALDHADFAGAEGENDDVLRDALEVCVLCNNAALTRGRDGVGDPLEIALLEIAAAHGVHRDDVVARSPREREEPFEPSTKLMATFHRREDKWLVAVKGAPEAVLAASTHVRTKEGRRPLTAETRARWADRDSALAADGLRILALAMRDAASVEEEPYRDLTLLALICFLDPARVDVGPAIEECRRAGVRVVMVTGDHAGTARHVARSVGIPVERAVVAGSDVPRPGGASRISPKEALTADVFARVAPEQKVWIVELHQEADNVVAMTGDGVNDAPALTRADIGVAMGKRGTQVAREAADIVLRDDSFATIVFAIRHGRVIFQNLRRFILYLFSCNMSEILVVALAISFQAPLALLPLQILFLNLVTDVFPALALGLGKEEADVMGKPPRPRGEALLRRVDWTAIVAYGIVLAGAVLVAFAIALGPMDLEGPAAVTISFLTLGFAQLWHVFNMGNRGKRLLDNEILRDRTVWAAVAFCVLLLLASVYAAPLSLVLSTVPPDIDAWALVIGMSLVPLFLGQAYARVRSRRPIG